MVLNLAEARIYSATKYHLAKFGPITRCCKIFSNNLIVAIKLLQRILRHLEVKNQLLERFSSILEAQIT